MRGEPAGEENGCIPWFGAALRHNDRPLPIEAHFYFRDFFARKLADAGGPLPRMSPCGLYYITRKGAGEGKVPDRAGMARRRNVENEADYLPALVAAGFQVVHLEDYDVDGKVRLFAGARLVLSPQSASLTFSLFMDKEADVVEIFPDIDHMKHYCYAALDNGHFWTRYSAVDTEGDEPDSNYGNGAFNMVVRDPAHLVQFVLDRLDHPEKRVHHTQCKIHKVYPED